MESIQGEDDVRKKPDVFEVCSDSSDDSEVEEIIEEDVHKIVMGETPPVVLKMVDMSVLQSPCQPLFILSNPLLTDPVLMTDNSGSVSNLSALLINVIIFWLD